MCIRQLRHKIGLVKLTPYLKKYDSLKKVARLLFISEFSVMTDWR